MERLDLKAVLAISGVVLTGNWVAAQSTGRWIIDLSDTVVTPDRPSLAVRISAGFPSPPGWSFHLGNFDLLSSDERGTLSGVIIPPPLGPLPPGSHGCFGLQLGSVKLGSVYGTAFGQIDILGCSAHWANPMPIWEATWTTSDFRMRTVRLATAGTTTFRVHTDSLGAWTELYRIGEFQHASASIQVRPSSCFADCDTSTGVGALDIFDFLCFMNLYVDRDPIACDCDTSNGPATCDIFDFLCFQSRFAAGCP